MSPKVAQIAQMTQDGPKRPNGPGCPKTVQGGPNFIDYTKMHKWQKKVQNGKTRLKWTKLQKVTKMDKNDPEWPRQTPIAQVGPKFLEWTRVTQNVTQMYLPENLSFNVKLYLVQIER